MVLKICSGLWSLEDKALACVQDAQLHPWHVTVRRASSWAAPWFPTLTHTTPCWRESWRSLGSSPIPHPDTYNTMLEGDMKIPGTTQTKLNYARNVTFCSWYEPGSRNIEDSLTKHHVRMSCALWLLRFPQGQEDIAYVVYHSGRFQLVFKDQLWSWKMLVFRDNPLWGYLNSKGICIVQSIAGAIALNRKDKPHFS